MQLLTPRLRLRPWTDADRDPFAAMSLDPAVMRFLRLIRSRTDSDAWIDRQVAHQARHGFCYWAAEHRKTGALVGAVGLVHVPYRARFTPAVEAGWRIAPAWWGAGFAPEAAQESLRHGFEVLHLPQVVAVTSPANASSRRVMAKLGMTHDEIDDFDHPELPDGHPLRPCMVYRLTREGWAKRGGAMNGPWNSSPHASASAPGPTPTATPSPPCPSTPTSPSI